MDQAFRYMPQDLEERLNMQYMEIAQNPDMDKYRIPQRTAKQMLLYDEAPVYRLLPVSYTHLPAEPEAASRTDGMDRIELIEAYREIIKENIEYDLLVLRYGRERLDETLELMLEVILSKRPYIRIAGDDFPREIVKSRFLKINSGHLEYVFDCIDKNTTKVGNIKAYLLAALYNAPATMDSYYRAEVNHDLYGC